VTVHGFNLNPASLRKHLTGPSSVLPDPAGGWGWGGGRGVERGTDVFGVPVPVGGHLGRSAPHAQQLRCWFEASAGPDAPLKLRQGISRRAAVAVRIVDQHTIVCRAPRIWRVLAEASHTATSPLLRTSWVYNVSISLNGGHDVTSLNESMSDGFKCADTPLQYGLSMRQSDTNYRTTTTCGTFRYVPIWLLHSLVCPYNTHSLQHALQHTLATFSHLASRHCAGSVLLTDTLCNTHLRYVSTWLLHGLVRPPCKHTLQDTPAICIHVVSAQSGLCCGPGNMLARSGEVYPTRQHRIVHECNFSDETTQTPSFGPESGGSVTTVTGASFVANAHQYAGCRFWDGSVVSPLVVRRSNTELLATQRNDATPAMLTCESPVVQVPRSDTLLRDVMLQTCLMQRPYHSGCARSGILLLHMRASAQW